MVLDTLSDRGLPVDLTKQRKLRQYIQWQELLLKREMQVLVPNELRPFKVYKGWPRELRTAVKDAGLYVKACLPEQFPELVAQQGYCFRDVTEEDESGPYPVERLVKLLEFNPGSSQQILAYIRYMGYRVPTKIDDVNKETTGSAELERLYTETGDGVLRSTVEMRKLRKIATNYAGGDWAPGSDGRVHPTYGFGTASGQLTARRPNSMNFPAHGELAKRAKACIRAVTGHTFVARDYRSFHARSLGWLSGDRRYMDMADYDIHSAVTAYFLKLPIAAKLFEMDGEELRSALSEIKAAHKDVRDQKAKRAILGLGFGMGVHKLYLMNPDAFDSPLEAAALITTIQELFPQAFVEFPKRMGREMKQGKIISPTKHQRWMWEQDLEQAVSYLPANIAHCHMFDSLLLMDEARYLDRYELCGFIHDSVIFHCPDALVAECLEDSRRIMERESTVLDGPLGRFTCRTDAKVGSDWATMVSA